MLAIMNDKLRVAKLECGIRWEFMSLTMMALVVIPIAALHGQGFTDPGFENYVLSDGGFVMPRSGAWLFTNEAGVVHPPAPNSGGAGTWSARFDPVEGQQYASSYAGGDTIRQSVALTGPAGDYQLSVYAAAPDGTVTINPNTIQLQSGEFTFTLGNATIGSLHTVQMGSGWNLYTADFSIAAPGNYLLGVKNTRTAPYFINYDAFAIQRVPEPSVIAMGLFSGVGAVVCRRRRKTEIQNTRSNKRSLLQQPASSYPSDHH